MKRSMFAEFTSSTIADDLHLRVHAGELGFRGLRLGHRLLHVRLIEQHLPLEIGDLDEITIDEHEVPHARARERVCDHGAESAAAEHDRRRLAKLPLASLAEAGEQHLSVVSGKVFGHGDCSIVPMSMLPEIAPHRDYRCEHWCAPRR